MKLSQEELEEIEVMAACNYSPEKIALKLDVDKAEFMKAWFNKESLVRYHYERGQLVADFEINQKQLDNAKAGNITAAQVYFKESEAQKVENLKKHIFYGSET